MNMQIIELNPERKQYIVNTAIGTAGGVAACTWLPAQAGKMYGKYVFKHSKRVSAQEQQEYWKFGNAVLNQSGLAAKGVIIKDINLNNCDEIGNDIINKRKALPQKKRSILSKIFSKKNISDEEYKARLRTYAEGRNACYIPAFSQVLVNKEKKSNAIFHELGHAYNAKGTGFKKFMSGNRNKAIPLIPIILLTSLLTPSEDKNNPAQNKFYKSLLFLKKYSGLMVSACMLPIVAEEGLASINGAKLAKNILPKNLYKKMNNFNAKAFASYTLWMICAGLGVTFANYVKDKVTGPLPSKMPKEGSNNQNIEEANADNHELIEK